MALGTGIFLIVVGAILTFALNTTYEAVNLDAVGWICMVAGAVAIIISLILSAQARTTTHREIRQERPNDQGPIA